MNFKIYKKSLQALAKFNETKMALRDINKSLSDRARQQFTAREDPGPEEEKTEEIEQQKKNSVTSKESQASESQNPDSQVPDSPLQENRRGGI